MFFLNHDYELRSCVSLMADSAGRMYALASVLSVLATVAIMLRFYARRLKQTALSWDDYVILLAWSFTIGTAICMFVGTSRGNLGQHTKIREDGSPVFDHRLKIFEQIVFASQLTSTLTFGLTKISVLLFYKRIFRGNVFVIAVWTMITVTSVWAVAFFFANLFKCWPLEINWYGFGVTEENCINTNVMYLAQAWSDILTDFLILSLPLPCIWALNMSTTHKLGISGMFLLGALTLGAGIAKLVVLYEIIAELNTGFLDISYLDTPLVYWPMVESSVGIVGACLPMLRPLFIIKPRHRPRRIAAFLPAFHMSSSTSPPQRSRFLALEMGNFLQSPLPLPTASTSTASAFPSSRASMNPRAISFGPAPPVLPSIAPSPFLRDTLDAIGIFELDNFR